MHKNVIQSLRSKRKRKDSEDADSGETDSEHPEVDLYQLQVASCRPYLKYFFLSLCILITKRLNFKSYFQVNTLRRYKKHYKVPSRPGLNKAQLADVSASNCI